MNKPCPHCQRPMLPYGPGYGDEARWVCRDQGCYSNWKRHLRCPSEGCGGKELVEGTLADGSKFYECTNCNFKLDPLQQWAKYQCDECGHLPMTLNEREGGGFVFTCPQCPFTLVVSPL